MDSARDAIRTSPHRGATVLLCVVFALSGAAALIFETLFFRLAGLALGNSVYAAAIVLFSFMAGLGAGNALAARGLRRAARPLLLFAALELTIAAYGALLCALFPFVTTELAPLARQLAEAGPALELLRLSVASLLFVVPAVAMGMTLPVLVGALSALDPNFGRVLGRLYGWNTLGAVVGVLAAERFLVASLGVSGAALAAAALDVAAAGGALWLRRSVLGDDLRAADRRGDTPGVDRVQLLLLSAAFMSGAILLSLEVVWFRFFLLFTSALSWNLALMLATVLAGIGAGGIAGAAWLERHPDAYRQLSRVAAASGIALALLYSVLAMLWPSFPRVAAVDVYIYLMFPVSFASGLLFTLLGRALEAHGLAPTVATGHLALANTAGSALGSLLGGFVLVPRVGIERSFLLLALAYGAVALVAAGAFYGGQIRVRRGAVVLLALYGFVFASFPSGALESRILSMRGTVRAHLEARGHELIAFEEAVTETVQYFRKPLLGAIHYFTLVTNNHSMASTELSNRRYMKAYVYWPLAVRPDAERALLISYGVGGTAQALAAAPGLQTIDVVDVSEAILGLSRLVYSKPGALPLDDPRVRVHVEDGRFFLSSTDRRFDLITGEPPPPRLAGVANLYSREYFELVRDHLRDGGIVTYWLSVHQLRPAETRAILRGFCDVFVDCSLWSGNGLEWMMVAVKNPPGPTSAEAFAAQWRRPEQATELAALGFADPSWLGPTFLADGERLRRWIDDTKPLVDDFPQRIASQSVAITAEDIRVYHALMADPEAERNFFRSETLDSYWPDAYRRPSPAHTRLRQLLLVELWEEPAYRALNTALSHPELEGFAAWSLGSDADGVAIAGAALAARADLLEAVPLPPDAYPHLAAAALARDDPPLADRVLARWHAALPPGAQRTRVAILRATLLFSAGETARAIEQVRALVAQSRDPEAAQKVRAFVTWASQSFEVDPNAMGG
jgi:predicted membrane-bound spermidine synthase